MSCPSSLAMRFTTRVQCAVLTPKALQSSQMAEDVNFGRQTLTCL